MENHGHAMVLNIHREPLSTVGEALGKNSPAANQAAEAESGGLSIQPTGTAVRLEWARPTELYNYSRLAKLTIQYKGTAHVKERPWQGLTLINLKLCKG